MGQKESEAVTQDTAQRESALHRWADDGGFIPDVMQSASAIATVPRNPWVAVGIAIGIGFTIGWLTGRR